MVKDLKIKIIANVLAVVGERGDLDQYHTDAAAHMTPEDRRRAWEFAGLGDEHHIRDAMRYTFGHGKADVARQPEKIIDLHLGEDGWYKPAGEK